MTPEQIKALDVESFGRSVAALKAFMAGAYADVETIYADCSAEVVINDLFRLCTVLASLTPDGTMEHLSGQVLLLAAQQAQEEL